MQATQLCFAGICGRWRTREEGNRARADSKPGNTLLGRLTPGGEKPKPVIRATNPDSTREDVVERKLIFLDVDGPLAPWRNGKEHKWTPGDSFEGPAYCKNVEALRRIIDSAGGPEVVKVVISSNWRTDPEKYPWLLEQMKNRGIDVVGHTDVMRSHPQLPNHNNFERILEIGRVLEHRMVGARGPYITDEGKNAFEALALPENWKITAWIAIDDLELAGSRYNGLEKVQYLSRFMPVPSDPDVDRGWMSRPENFAEGMRAWLQAFATSHFVHVGATGGVAGTRKAEERAIRLLHNG